MSDDELTGLTDHDTAGAALGALSADELDALRQAAAADPRLDAELAASEAAVAEMGRLAPTAQINRGRSAGIRSRLLSRAAASRDGRSVANRTALAGAMSGGAGEGVRAKSASVPARREPTSVSSSSPARHDVPAPTEAIPFRSAKDRGKERIPTTSGAIAGAWQFLAAAAVLACIATGTQLYRVIQQRNALEQQVEAGRTMSAKMVAMEGAMVAKDQMISSLTGPDMRVVNLVNYRSQDPLARMFWDRKTHAWMMYAYHLQQPKAGRTYQVWLIASNAPAPISAGTFKPEADGSAIVRATYAMDPGALERVAVSEEPDGGMPAPTGPIVIAGR